MSFSPEIRAFRVGDEKAINDAFNAVFGTDRTLEEWRWKFGERGERAAILVAVDGDEVVAHFAALRMPLRLDRRALMVGQTVDVFARRRDDVVRSRIFERLVKAFYQCFGGRELDALFGFPGRRHLALGQRKLGYAKSRPVPVWRRPVRPVAHRPRRVELSELPSPAQLDRLWSKARPRLEVAFVRDAAHVARRFTDRPGVEYPVLVARRLLTGIEACAVCRVDGTILRVADLLWDGARPLAMERIDAALDGLASERSADHLELWLGGDSAAEATVERLGWQRVEHSEQLCCTAVSFRDDLDADDLVARIYVTMHDADLV